MRPPEARTVVIEPVRGARAGWIVRRGLTRIDVVDKLAWAQKSARSELVRIGGGDLEIHLRYGRTKLLRHVGMRASEPTE